MYGKFWQPTGLYLAPDEGGGGGAGGNDETNDEAGGEQGVGGQTGDATGDENGGKIEFSPEQQAHIDKIVSDRLKRDREAQARKVEAAQKAAADDAEKARLKEQEEWKALAEKHESAAVAAQAAQAEAIQTLNEERLNNMIERVARSLHFHDENDAKARIDMAMVVQDEETGQWDEKSVEKALKKLAEENKHLIDEGNGKGRLGTPPRGRQLQKQGTDGTATGRQVKTAPKRVQTF
jgi:hypothetical protein